MILNMNSGSGPVTVVDFTLSQDIPVDSVNAMGSNVLTVGNVFLPDDIVHGFVIRPLDVDSNYVNSVSQIYTDIYGDYGSSITRLRYIKFAASGGVYECGYNPNDDAYIYNTTTKTLKVSTASSNAIMKAGNYRLMIW